MISRLSSIGQHLKMTSNSDIHLCELPYMIGFLFPSTTADPHTDTTGTPNGIKASILLEELGLKYQVSSDGGCCWC